MSSRKIADVAAERPSFFVSLVGLASVGIEPADYGIVALCAAGNAIGAVGITGDTSGIDETFVLASLSASSLGALT